MKFVFNYYDSMNVIKELRSLTECAWIFDTKNPQNPEFMIQLKSILGKSVDENELINLSNLDNENLSHKIKNNFEEKRNERLKYLDKKKSEEFEKNIFLQLIDQNWKFHILYLELL